MDGFWGIDGFEGWMPDGFIDIIGGKRGQRAQYSLAYRYNCLPVV